MSEPKFSCGIVLHPAGHTRSPAMHRAAYRALDLDASYTAYDVPPDELASAMARFRSQGLRQLAISIPHKEAMMNLVDEVEPVGRAIGAINTATLVGDRYIGTNTDWLGAIRALEREGPVEGQRAVVLGAGGTARALVYGLLERGCEVRVLNRTVERAEALASDLGAHGSGPIEALADEPYDVLVNTTSVGLRSDESPIPIDHQREGAIVMDAVYDPEETRLLKDARARGARPIGGKWMLVYQAAEQLERWTGRQAPIDVLAEAFDQAGS